MYRVNEGSGSCPVAMLKGVLRPIVPFLGEILTCTALACWCLGLLIGCGPTTAPLRAMHATWDQGRTGSSWSLRFSLLMLGYQPKRGSFWTSGALRRVRPALATAFGNGDDRLQLQFAKLFALLSELMGTYGREPQNACKLTSQYDLAPRFLLKAWPATLGKPRRLGSRHGTAHSSACEGEVCVTS